MKYFKRLKLYKNHSGANVYDPDSMEAYSYGWWRYLQKIGPFVVYNNYSYSKTTTRHQRQTLDIIGYKTDISIEAPKGLQRLGIAHEHYAFKIAELRIAINIRGSRKSTNIERLETIAFYQNQQRLVSCLVTLTSDNSSDLNKRDAERIIKNILRQRRIEKISKRLMERAIKRVILNELNF